MTVKEISELTYDKPINAENFNVLVGLLNMAPGNFRNDILKKQRPVPLALSSQNLTKTNKDHLGITINKDKLRIPSTNTN